MLNIEDNYKVVRENIEAAAEKAGRSFGEVELLAVTKTVEAESIKKVYSIGCKVFGENRIQEYVSKKDLLPEDCKWHIIGRLQKNKIKYIAGNVALVHSLCSKEIAEEMQKQLEKRGLTQDCLIEVNVTGEESKDGIAPSEIVRLIDEIACYDRVKIKGLMTIGRYSPNPEDARGCFAKLRSIFDKLSLEYRPGFEMKYLSMGMSDDYSVAVEEGANIVRIGSAIFGKRNH